MWRWIGSGLLLGIAIQTSGAAEPDRPVNFARDIQPVLAERCLSCHGPDLQESNLRVDLRDSLWKGGDSETPTVLPKQITKSTLIERITADDPDLRMPPEGKPLTAVEIDRMKRWIQSGANMPAKFVPTKRTESSHWAFQPVKQVPVPEITGAHVLNPIDAFIQRQLHSRDLSASSQASRAVLIRRLTLDLTGLPPTPGEIRDFESDRSPQAYERLVDRLLASPAYGERWGRHWLDVVRYADSNGLDENVAHGTAWRYRDYVVSSLNADKSYSRFVREQIAGDLLAADTPQTRNEQRIATGFLSLGPKVLAEPDETKMEMDIVDEQIDTFGKAFLGLTLGCARCHDHKFDPITTEDYYALAGIFQSTKTMDSFKKIAKWHESELPTPELLQTKQLHDEKLAAKQREIDGLIKAANEALLTQKAEGAKLPKNPEAEYPEATRAKLKSLKADLEKLKKSAPVIPTAMGVTEGKVMNTAVHQRGSHLTLGKEVPRRVPKVLTLPGQSSIPKETSGRLQLANWLTDANQPLTARVIVNRVWRWHFGRGLVDSTDNFGELGGEPTHPELLDWLAGRLMSSAWSLKTLHRLIVTSHTYQQSSAVSVEHLQAQKVDPENRFLWRANVRRLEAEAIRDNLLAVSGTLDRRMGGSQLNTKNREHIFNHTSQDNTTYNFDCRSLYLPVVRNNLYDLFQLFDYTDASMVNGNRSTSTVAPQALFLMNAPLAQSAATQFARRLLREVPSESRIQVMYQIAFGRSPNAAELSRMEAFLTQYKDSQDESLDQSILEEEAWTTLCQVVLASNEFVTIR